ncbi:MAG: insulinase family protein [Candidatus Eisenbacteria bacterium]|uniref:Insulinase family protein n=1 Tax=Eiseniibacteriota bacterium TaxID=2212470 RepID=A0A948W6E6_UNCEI|nr:insulinase family protein [Candidatus Eisenbacteria bacterium]MBU1948565.1 insulinase family protein [Candidatus Eisenbacteria bacterium]MBU2691045.1 insulinase family protein [Candidatus Eisenbacteria bacterium]
MKVRERILKSCLPALLVIGLVGPLSSTAADSSFEELAGQVQRFELENGLRFLVLERHDAPVFTFFTLVNVGGVDESGGNTGLAHMFEHMAFKGTTSLGATDFKAEMQAMQKTDEAFDAWLSEHRKGILADPERLEDLDAAFKEAREEAGRYVTTNRFPELIEEYGGRGLNAFTGTDMTGYFYSLPSNKLEFWALLESDRFANPVLREFYKERDVVIEERRRGSESTPLGRLYNETLSVAFLAHPYRDGIIGHRSDLESFTRDDAREFYKTYYIANNMVIALVGDVDFETVEKLAKKYFSKIPSGPHPPYVDTIEPEQAAERRVIMEEEAQPVVMIEYHIPSKRHPDWYTYELLADILGSGRTSRLNEAISKRDKMVGRIGASVGTPGDKYPNLFSIFAIVAEGHKPLEVEEAIYQEIDRLVKDGVTQEELDKVRSRIKSGFVRRLRSNWGMAYQLAIFETEFGDGRRLFNVLDHYSGITPGDIQRVASEVFKKRNRTVGILKRPEPGESS